MIKRIVSTSFWTDGKVVDEFSPEDKYFMLYLLTNPHTTQLGIYEFNLRVAAFELGYSLESVSVMLDRFENKYGIIKRSTKTKEIAILNYLVYSVVKGGKPVMDLLLKESNGVKDINLLKCLSKHLSTKKNLLPTIQQFIDCINDNDNDNDNDSTQDNTVQRTVDRTVQRTQKHKYGEYNNVLLSDEDYDKLVNEFPIDYQERIERLSEYMASTGKSYKNHLATIRNWARKEKKPEHNTDKEFSFKDLKFDEEGNLI